MNAPDIGALVGAGFGGGWGLAGSLGLPGRFRGPAIALSLAITALLIAWPFAIPRTAAGAGTFDGAIYGIAVAAEAMAIAIAAVILNRRRRPDLLLPAVGIIVGLHFIGLWRATALPLFLAVAGAMCAVSAIALLLPRRGPSGIGLRQAVAGLGCALVLWAAAAVTLF